MTNCNAIYQNSPVLNFCPIMNHDSGFIIGIAHVFCKNPNRTHTLNLPEKASTNYNQPSLQVI